VSDPTTYQRITLKFQTPYAREGGDYKEWTVKFALSGESLSSQSDADATALALADPVLSLASGATSYTGYLHYAAGSDVNDFQNTYAIGTYPGTFDGYTGADKDPCQLEVCVLARAYVGINSKGRAKYLFKHIHDCAQVAGSSGVTAAIEGTPLAAWSTGVGPHDLVTVDPTTGTASDAWTIHTALYTRQLRRGQKSPS